MSSLALVLVLASALSHAAWNAMIKGRGGDPLAASTGLSLVWALLGVPLVVFVVGPLEPAAWPWVLASTAVHLAYFTMLVRAYREADLSVVYTLARGLPPLIVALASLALPGERPGALGMIGVLAITAGVLTLGMPSASGAPSRRVLALALAIALCIATYTVLDGLGARVAGSTATYVVWLCMVQGASFAAGALALRGRALAREVRAGWKIGLLSGVLSGAGYGVALWAMEHAPIAVVAAVREVSVVFAALIGMLALREPFGRRRMIAAVLVALGVIAVRAGA